ncbi:MAG: HEPN domain-containing protein [Aquificaceae bacterium]
MTLLVKNLKGILRRLGRDIEKSTGKSLSLLLFGSYARGDFHSGSDVDIFVIVPENWTDIDKQKAMEIITKYNNLYNTFISPIFVKENQLKDLTIRPIIHIYGEARMEEKERFSESSKLKYAEMHLSKAQRHLQRAKQLFEIGMYPPAVHEAYYSVFHSSKAYLFLLGEDPQTNKGVRQLMNLYLFKEKKYFSFSKIYDQAMYMRQRADYDVIGDFIDREECEKLLKDVEIYMEQLEKIIQNLIEKV